MSLKNREEIFESSGSNALGLALESPFVVVPSKKTMTCPHLISLAMPRPDVRQLAQFYTLARECERVRTLLPVPKTDQGLFYLNENDLPAVNRSVVLTMRSQMASPIRATVMPFPTSRCCSSAARTFSTGWALLKRAKPC